MKKYFFTVIVLLCVATSYAQDFRGIVWGSNINDVDVNLIKEESWMDIDFFFNPEDRMGFGDAEVDHIVYGFVNGKFKNVIISFSGEDNFEKILGHLSKHLGKPESIRNSMVWDDKALLLDLSYNDMFGGTLSIEYIL